MFLSAYLAGGYESFLWGFHCLASDLRGRLLSTVIGFVILHCKLTVNTILSKLSGSALANQ
jgi:hypothetical protein